MIFKRLKKKAEEKAFLHPGFQSVCASVCPGTRHVTEAAPMAARLWKFSDKRSSVNKQHAGGVLLTGAIAGAAEPPRPRSRSRSSLHRPRQLQQPRQHHPAPPDTTQRSSGVLRKCWEKRRTVSLCALLRPANIPMNTVTLNNLTG